MLCPLVIQESLKWSTFEAQDGLLKEFIDGKNSLGGGLVDWAIAYCVLVAAIVLWVPRMYKCGLLGAIWSLLENAISVKSQNSADNKVSLRTSGIINLITSEVFCPFMQSCMP